MAEHEPEAPDPEGPPTLKELSNALSSVTNWHTLGVKLGLEICDLNTIERNYPRDSCRCRDEMLDFCLRSTTPPTWNMTVDALHRIGEHQLAIRIRSEHPGSFTASREPPSLAHLQGAQAQPHSLSLEEEIKQFEEKYEDLVDYVLSAFKTGGVSIKRVLKCLRQLPVSLKLQCGEFLQSQAARLCRASSIDELFIILSLHWDFLNPSLLAHLAYRFGDEETIRTVDKYLEELREFRMRTKISDFIDKWTGTLLPDTQEIVMELEDNWGERSLQQLEELRIEVSRKRCFEDYVMPLKRIKVSSVDAIFSLPESVDIHSLELESLREVFQKHQVLRILVNGVCQFQGLEEERRLLESSRTDFETRLLPLNLQSQGLNRPGRLLEEVNMQSQIQLQGEHLENQTNREAEQCVSDPRIEHTQSNYTEGSIPNVMFPGIEDRLLSQSLQTKGLEGAGRLLEEMYTQKQIPPRAECAENQTNCTVQVMKKLIMHKPTTQTDQSEPIVVDSSDDEDEAQVSVPFSPSLQFQGLEGVGTLMEEQNPHHSDDEDEAQVLVPLSPSLQFQGLEEVGTLIEVQNPHRSDDEDEAQVLVLLSPSLQFQGLEGVGTLMEVQNPHCSGDEDETQVLVPLSPSLQFQGLEEERRLLEEQNPQSHIQIQRELECTKNQMGTIMLEAGQATSMSDPVPTEDPNNITQCPVSNKHGIQERDMDCTEVYVTPEGGQHESGIDIRPAVGINDRDIPQRGRKRGLSPDPSPSKRKFIRMKRDESYVEQCLYAIILPFQCPSNQKVVKVGVSGNPKRRFDQIKWGLKAIIPDEFAEPAELKLKDGICLSRTTPADKIIDEIFISRIRMQAVEHQKAELEVRNLIMAAKNIDRDFTMSLEEAIYDTSDTREEADKKIHRINNSCGPTEWILSDTRTVEALRNAYKNGELNGTAKSMMDDKPIWGSYQEFIGELQKVRRNVYQ